MRRVIEQFNERLFEANCFFLDCDQELLLFDSLKTIDNTAHLACQVVSDGAVSLLVNSVNVLLGNISVNHSALVLEGNLIEVVFVVI